MGKIVKYCAVCDESFAEKFAFCPNCGKGMQAFEMNPLAGMTSVAEKANVGASNGNGYKADAPAPVVLGTPAKIEQAKAPEAAAFSPVGETRVAADRNETESIESKPEVSKTAELKSPVKETKTFTAAASNGNDNGHKSQTSNDGYRTVESQTYQKADDGFRVTVIEEKNVKQRNMLLLGSLLLMLTIGAGGMIYSLFNYNLSIAAIGDESGLSLAIVDEVPMEVEEEAPKPKEDKDAGGGGGGGRDEPTPTSQGRLATQTEKPLIAPDKSIVQKDFELKQPVASTQGKMQIKPTEGPYGDPNARAGLTSSNGMGTGGGQGSGIGTGQGSGRGTGAGSGIGSGFGSGEGDGIGGGRGSGTQGIGAPPAPPAPKKPVPVVTEPFKIVSKPRPGYTDAARQNQVTGVVRVRVQFLASGQVGSVSAVSGLPYGLTEQAIAAAKSIKFEPQKKNGVPVGTTKVIEYSFTIY
ncbi:MAG: energy transducer TonB [Acidobacteriota bacterium]|nr:energy transducer TonB [Acidobacteriota bacterium]